MQVSTASHILIREVLEKGVTPSWRESAAGLAAVGAWVWWAYHVDRRMAALVEGQAAMRRDIAAMPAIICGQLAAQLKLHEAGILDAVNTTLHVHGVRAVADPASKPRLGRG